MQISKYTLLLLPFALVIVGIAVADIHSANAATFEIPNPLRYGTIPELFDAITGFLLWIATPILTVMVIWAGFLFLTSGGVPAKIQEAQKALIWAGIGFAIVLINRGIALIIREILGGGS